MTMSRLGDVQFILLLTAGVCLFTSELSQGRSFGAGSGANGDGAKSGMTPLWQPESGDREEWLSCHGMPCSQWRRAMGKVKEIQDLESKDVPGFENQRAEQAAEGCFWYSEEQADAVLKDLKEGGLTPMGDLPEATSRVEPLMDDPKSRLDSAQLIEEILKHKLDEDSETLTSLLRLLGKSGGSDSSSSSSGGGGGKQLSRRKRKLENFAAAPGRKWQNPIFFKFDGVHEPHEQDIIRRAFYHWEDHTCMRFFEVNTEAPISQSHLLMTAEPYGAYSFIGRTTTNPQQINVGPAYLKLFGTPVHEIGHALGLWHEQQRVDRDDYINLVTNNIAFYRSQFWKRNTVSHGVPYDYSSVMHYPWTAGSFNKQTTIEAKRPNYMRSMGQRVGLSYLDAKIVNEEYCSDSCKGRPLARNCERGGYQDPNNCLQCRCPDGFGGQFCQLPGPAKNAECGDVIYANVDNNPTYITSPGYVTPGYYADHVECNWVIKAPLGHKVVLTFEGEFGAYCHELETCYHWVEVKHTEDFEYPGPRFCCYDTPEGNLTSVTNEMAISFRSNFSTIWATVRRGFMAKIQVVPELNVGGSPGVFSSVGPTTPTPSTATPPGTTWGDWGRCQDSECKCGGCSKHTRHRMCHGKRCMGELSKSETRACVRVCTGQDTMLKFAGIVYEAPCPVCCAGYRQRGDNCVPE